MQELLDRKRTRRRRKRREELPMDRNFGPRLRQLRTAQGLSQTELARRAGVSKQAISLWELSNREPGWSEMKALRRALGVTCEQFDVPADDPIPSEGDVD